jgi:hypothetical protein
MVFSYSCGPSRSVLCTSHTHTCTPGDEHDLHLRTELLGAGHESSAHMHTCRRAFTNVGVHVKRAGAGAPRARPVLYI